MIMFFLGFKYTFSSSFRKSIAERKTVRYLQDAGTASGVVIGAILSLAIWLFAINDAYLLLIPFLIPGLDFFGHKYYDTFISLMALSLVGTFCLFFILYF